MAQGPFEQDMVRVDRGVPSLTENDSIKVENFEMGRYEVTQAQWVSIMGTSLARMSEPAIALISYFWEGLSPPAPTTFA